MSARNLNKFGKQVNLAGFTPENIIKAVPSLALWGGSAVAGGRLQLVISASICILTRTVLLYTQGVKKMRNDVLESIPFISDYFKSTHEIPASVGISRFHHHFQSISIDNPRTTLSEKMYSRFCLRHSSIDSLS